MAATIPFPLMCKPSKTLRFLSPGEGKRGNFRAEGMRASEVDTTSRSRTSMPDRARKTWTSWRASRWAKTRPGVAFDVRPLVYKQRQHLPRSPFALRYRKSGTFPSREVLNARIAVAHHGGTASGVGSQNATSPP